MIVMADVGTLSPEIRERLATWIEDGGVLVRFAGPRLAQGDDDLVPVKLRRGGRTLGGSLTWEKPQHLASFTADGPFAGLAVPQDVTINRQVLAEPDATLATRSWASLEDGTPLVTGERRGKGVVALFHVSADMRWSDLPMSGTFVEMLRRIVDMSGYTSTPGAGVASEGGKETVAPLHTLDGFGAFGPPPATARPLPARLPRPRDLGSSAGILWTGGRPARGEYACRRRPHRIARYISPACAPRQLYQCRAARSQRHAAVGCARTVPDRCDRGRPAGRRPRRLAATARGTRRAGVVLRPYGPVGRAIGAGRRRQGRLCHEGGFANPPRLCRHRQCRRQFHRQGRDGGAHAVSRATHGAGSRRSPSGSIPRTTSLRSFR